MAKDAVEGLKEAIRVDSEHLRGHVYKVVRSGVEGTLNGMLKAEVNHFMRCSTA